MSMQSVEMLLSAWRELERELETSDEDSREDLQARIRELRDHYQELVMAGQESDAGPAQGATGAA
jgi:hypothetical protein